MKPFRFGVQVSRVGSASEWRDKARKLEDLGFSTLFMPDHFGPELAPLPAIAMAAAHTTTLRVGSLVFDNDYKHPAILAKEAATIDLLCGGRLELGIGAGWMRTDYDQLGLPYDPPAVRVDRFEEALHVIKQCFTGVAQARPAAGPAAADRRGRQARPVDRGARGRHRRDQSEPARR